MKEYKLKKLTGKGLSINHKMTEEEFINNGRLQIQLKKRPKKSASHTIK